MAILVDPDPHIDRDPVETQATPTLIPDQQGYLPDQASVDAAVLTYRMWTACDLAGSPFQRWAVETPSSVQRYILGVLPNLTSEEEARAILQELWDTGESDILLPEVVPEIGIPVEPGSLPVIVIDPNPAHSWLWAGQLYAGVIMYERDGSRQRELSAQESSQYAQATRGENSGCDVPVFMLAEDGVTLLVEESRFGCG